MPTVQAGKPEYMKTSSGRVLEMQKSNVLPTDSQQMHELASMYENTVIDHAPVTFSCVLPRRFQPTGVQVGWHASMGDRIRCCQIKICCHVAIFLLPSQYSTLNIGLACQSKFQDKEQAITPIMSISIRLQLGTSLEQCE